MSSLLLLNKVSEALSWPSDNSWRSLASRLPEIWIIRDLLTTHIADKLHRQEEVIGHSVSYGTEREILARTEVCNNRSSVQIIT